MCIRDRNVESAKKIQEEGTVQKKNCGSEEYVPRKTKENPKGVIGRRTSKSEPDSKGKGENNFIR